MHILLADDDNDDTELFYEAVQQINPKITCEIVSDGSDILAKLRDPIDEMPDVVFLDINMPNVNGWVTLKALRNDQRFLHIPIIIYSTSSSQRDKQIAIDLNATAFFTKPEKFDELKFFIKHIVENIQTSSKI